MVSLPFWGAAGLSNSASSFEQEFDNIWVIKRLKLVQGQRSSNDAGHRRRS